jgi:hypothetical protein
MPSKSFRLEFHRIDEFNFDTSEITDPGAMVLQVWEAVLAA